MIKNDIIKAITSKLYIKHKDSVKITDDLLKSFTKCLKKEGKIVIVGFGKFTVKQKSKRIGRNPKNKKTYEISARKVVSFYPSRVFKNELNNNKNK